MLSLCLLLTAAALGRVETGPGASLAPSSLFFPLCCLYLKRCSLWNASSHTLVQHGDGGWAESRLGFALPARLMPLHIAPEPLMAFAFMSHLLEGIKRE